MPLLKFDLIEGRSEEQLKAMLDSAHRAVLEAFNVPQRDRYQIVTEHKPYHFVVQDTGLDIERTRNLVVVTVITSPRTEQSKQAFYSALTREMKHCGIAPADVMVSIITNDRADWSFGNGVAQYVTGEL